MSSYDYHYIPHRPRPSEGRAVLVLSKSHEPFTAIVASWSRDWAARVDAWRATGANYGLLAVELTERDDGSRSPLVGLFSATDLEGLTGAAHELCETAGDLTVDADYFQSPDMFGNDTAVLLAVKAGFAKAAVS